MHEGPRLSQNASGPGYCLLLLCSSPPSRRGYCPHATLASIAVQRYYVQHACSLRLRTRTTPPSPPWRPGSPSMPADAMPSTTSNSADAEALHCLPASETQRSCSRNSQLPPGSNSTRSSYRHSPSPHAPRASFPERRLTARPLLCQLCGLAQRQPFFNLSSPFLRQPARFLAGEFHVQSNLDVGA